MSNSTTIFGWKSILAIFAVLVVVGAGAYYVGQHGVDAFIKEYNAYRATAVQTTDSLVRHSDSLTITLDSVRKSSRDSIDLANKQKTILVTQLGTNKDSVKKLNHVADSLKKILPPVCDPLVLINTALQTQDSIARIKYDSVITQNTVVVNQYIKQVSLADSIILQKDTTIHKLQKTIDDFPKPSDGKIFGVKIPTFVKVGLVFIGGMYAEHKLTK